MIDINGATRLLAILGDPIAHAAAPALANAALAARGVDARLVPWHVRSADLAVAVAALRAIENIDGAIVTMPHKIAVLPLLDTMLPEAATIGAVNVIRRRAGALEGANLDGEGFADGLESAGHALAGRRVYLAGAGGAAGAIAFALAARGIASLAIGNRTRSRAERLVDRVHRAFPRLSVSVGTGDACESNLVVNATSLGMRAGEALPLDVDTIDPNALAAEVVITPADTPFLTAARLRGCTTHPGRPMLVAQIGLMLDFMLQRE